MFLNHLFPPEHLKYFTAHTAKAETGHLRVSIFSYTFRQAEKKEKEEMQSYSIYAALASKTTESKLAFSELRDQQKTDSMSHSCICVVCRKGKTV